MKLEFEQKEDSLSLGNTNCLKGVLAVCVFVCHFWANIASNNMISTDHCVIFIFFYFVANLVLGETIKLTTIIQSFAFGGTIISKGWYLQSILLWYILFLFSFKLVKKEKIKLVFLFVSFVFYVAFCLVLKLSSTWYEGCFCLFLGVVWAKRKKEIEAFLSRKYISTFLMVVSLFSISFVLGNFSILGKIMSTVFKCISASFFSVLMVLLLKFLNINNAITRFLGKLYLEIYLLHGFFLNLFCSKYISIKNPLLYGFLTFAGTLILAMIIHPGIQKILTFGKNRGGRVGK